ncbi:MAG: hypothetical protein ACREPQ_20665 [Rhodanobacter sp.]
MERKTWQVGMVAGLVLVPLAAAYAAKTETVVKAENKAEFAAVVVAVHQQMEPGGRYEFVDKNERAKIDADLGNMQALFDKYGTVTQMKMGTRVQLFNEQEEVNAILTRRDDQRLVCESIAPVGSHIPRTTCRTYRQMQQDETATQNLKKTMLQVPQVLVPHGSQGSVH